MILFESAFIKTLKNAYQLDPVSARARYNELGAILFLGVGIVALSALLLVPWFDYKGVVYAYTAYCFFVPAFNRVHPRGFSLTADLLQIPLGLMMIVSLQAMMPLDLLYLTAFLYPILFIFAYEFHHRRFTGWVFFMGLAITGLIVSWRDLPHWQPYLVTTFGSTLIIGRVVESAAQKIIELANHDGLTGLSNRRCWEESLYHMISLAKRDKQPVTLVFLDIDRFKQVNDEQGHAAGDELLKVVADNLKAECRDSDFVARWGGDEFAIALPHAGKPMANRLVQRLRERIQETSISAGVVTLRGDETMDELISRADHEMYKDKVLRHRDLEEPVFETD